MNERRDEDLGVVHLAGRWIDDGDLLAGVVDEHLSPATMERLEEIQTAAVIECSAELASIVAPGSTRRMCLPITSRSRNLWFDE